MVRRLVALAVTSLVVSAFLASPARAADRPESFVATSSARALELNVLGIKLTVGSSGAFVSTPPATAKADGAGVLLIPGTVSHSELTGADGVQSPPKACVLNLPVAGLLEVQTACGESRVSISGGLPNAYGAGNIAAINLQGQSLLADLLSSLQPVLDSVISTVDDQVLNPLLGPLLTPLLQTLGINPETGLVSELVTRLQQATAVLQIRLGDSVAEANTTAAAARARSSAQGARIDVLPGVAAGGAPLLSIVVGSANASAEYNRGSGESTSAFDPAIATITLGLPILGGDVTTIPVALGSPVTLLAGTPLESTISLGAGRATKDPDGTARAVADGVSLRLLTGLNGGIALELAHAEAAAGGLTRIASPPAPVEELAKTGSDPWLPLAGAGLMLAAYGTRRLVVRPARAKENAPR